MKKKKDMENLTHTLRSQGKRRIPSDVMGSYTGTYDDEEDMQPVQEKRSGFQPLLRNCVTLCQRS